MSQERVRGSFVTAADVAERVGVSRSAVSRTFTPGASAPRRRELSDALGVPDDSATQPEGVPYPKATPPAAPEKNVLGEIFGSSVARSVIRSVAVGVAGTVTRSLLGAMGVRGRYR